MITVSKNSAIPLLFMVDDKFHAIHRALRRASLKNNHKEWIKKADELARNIENSMSQPRIFTPDLEKTPANNLPHGALTKGDTMNLISIYASSPKRWNNFHSGDRLNARLVCYWCVWGWLKEYRKGIVWENRRKEDGNSYILGTAKKSRESCNVSFNISKHAVHPRKDPKFKKDPGYICKEKGITSLRPSHGFGLMIDPINRTSEWKNRLYFREVGEGYPYVEENITALEDYEPGISTQTFQRYAGLMAIGNDFAPSREYGSEVEFNFHKYNKSNVVILEGVAKKNGTSKVTIDYIIPDQSKTVHAKFEELNHEEHSLGFFIFTRERGLLRSSDLIAFNEVPLWVTEGLSSRLGWKPTEGQLYRVKREFFQDDDEANSNSLAIAEIDMNKRMDSPLLERIKERNPSTVLPTIRTSMKFIQAFLFTEGRLQRISQDQKLTVRGGHRAKILVNLSGFKLEQTKLGLRILPEKEESTTTLRDTDAQPTYGFASFNVPRKLKTTIFRIQIPARDHASQGDTVYFRLHVIGSKDHLQDPKNINLEVDFERNVSIIRAYNKHKMMNGPLGLTESRANALLSSDGLFSELVKLEFNQSSSEDFVLPTARLQNRYIGLNFLAFKESGRDFKMSKRLRTSGIYYPVAPELMHNDGESFGSTNKWAHFEHHLVKLTPELHLLFTPHPLDHYGIDLTSQFLSERGMKVTSFGAVIEGPIPSELASLEILDKPRFLDFYSNSPKQHMELMNHLFETLPKSLLKTSKDAMEKHFTPIAVLHGSATTHPRTYAYRKPRPNESWQKVDAKPFAELPISQNLIQLSPLSGEDVFFDIVFLERKTGDEIRVVLRRILKNGTKNYLTIARFVEQNGGIWRDQQLDWVTGIQRNDTAEFEHLFRWIGGKFGSRDLDRAYDWHFMQIETLRAFLSLGNMLPGNWAASYKAESLWPVPLRQFLLGHGNYLRNQKTYEVPGILNQNLTQKNNLLRAALEDKVAHWIWSKANKND